MDTKQKIFEAAVRFFARKGYNGTSMRDLSKEVGIKESTLYYHFENKAAILDAILQFYIEGFGASLPTPDEMELMAKRFTDPVQLWLNGARDFYSKQPELLPLVAGILLNEMFLNEKCREFVLHTMFKIQKESTEFLIRDMVERGLIKNCDIKKTAAQYVYMLHGLDIENRLQLQEGKSKEDVFRHIFENITFFIENLIK